MDTLRAGGMDGIWTRILKAFTKRAKGRLFCIDSSYVRVNGSASNPAGGQDVQAMGPSRGGLTTKIHALVDGRGRALRLVLSAGNKVDITQAPDLVKGLGPMGCTVLIGDKGCDSDALRALLYEQHIFPCFAVNRKRITNRDFHRGFYPASATASRTSSARSRSIAGLPPATTSSQAPTSPLSASQPFSTGKVETIFQTRPNEKKISYRRSAARLLRGGSAGKQEA
jgi:transposase